LPDSGKRCAMEWVSYLAGEPHTDQPVCVDPPLRTFCIKFNDALGDDARQGLRPYLARCIGTAGDGRTVERGYLCLDWIVRTYTPAWLDLAGLVDDANALRVLTPITDLAAARVAGPVVRAARDAARAGAWAGAGAAAWDAAGAAAGAAARAAAGAAAGDAAGDAAWAAAGAAARAAARAAAGDAARDAARDAAWAAARDAARAAAGAAAGDAAGDAARDAAWDAAWAALAPTVKTLQASAFDLLDRMLPTVMVELPAETIARVEAMA
jgi:hypothetical protein